jgi:hypothetical protein
MLFCFYITKKKITVINFTTEKYLLRNITPTFTSKLSSGTRGSYVGDKVARA